MADVIKPLRQYFLSKTAITDLVGQRIYASRLPQNATIPAVVMRILTEQYEHNLAGLSGIVQTRVSIECYASSAETARAIATAIIWSGVDTLKGVYQSLNFRSVMVEDGRREFEDEDTQAGDAQRHVVTFDLMVIFLKG